MPTPSRNVLADFTAATAIGRAPRTRQRDATVMAELVRYLDHADVTRHLGSDPATLVSLEREVSGSEGSFFRVFGVGELVCCLPGFLDISIGGSAPDATRVALAGRLLRWISRQQLLDSQFRCALYEAEDAVRHARQARREAIEPDHVSHWNADTGRNGGR